MPWQNLAEDLAEEFDGSFWDEMCETGRRKRAEGWRRQDAKRAPRPRLPPGICKECGKRAESAKKWYCSPLCKRKAGAKQDREYKARARAKGKVQVRDVDKAREHNRAYRARIAKKSFTCTDNIRITRA